MPTLLTVPITESAHKTLDQLVRTSGLAPEIVLEQAIDEYYQRNAALLADPRFAPYPGSGSQQPALPTIHSAIDRITKTPGVCGGRACIRGTRITVWGLVAYRKLGASDADILRAVQGLTLADLQAGLEYADANREEIDRDIRENEEGEAGPVQ